MAVTSAASVRRKNRIFLLSIIALFVLPLLVAWLLVGRWQSGGTSNYGELLNPARPVAHLSATPPEGRPLNQEYLRYHWTLVYTHTGAGCDSACRKSLYNMRQVRLALGKDIDRAQTLYLPAQAPDADLLEWLSREHAAMTVGAADQATVDFFMRVFPNPAADKHWIYLVDPLGNVLMRYDSEQDPKGMLKDLKHLLKLSKIG